MKDEQKADWFTHSVNPNSRIPAIVDRSRNGVRVFETDSILLYLSKAYDVDYKLHFEDEADEAEMVRPSVFSRIAVDVVRCARGVAPLEHEPAG